jgi:hypothetical protein
LCSLIIILLLSCKPSIDEPTPVPVPPNKPIAIDTNFIKGADISWVTEMESKDIKFYNKNGVQTECFALMKEHLPFTDEEIGDYFGGRSRQYVNNELTKLPINHEKLATKQETKFVNNFLYLTAEVLKFKNEYSTKENNIK